MALTLNMLYYDILETVSNNNISDDTDISARYIEYLIHQQRALWLRNEYNKPGRSIDQNVTQDLGCVELELVDSSFAICNDLEVGCSLLRSKLVIPNTVEFYERTAITKVGPIDQMNVSFSFVPYQQAIYSGNGKFTKNVIYCFLHDNRMYLKVTGQAGKMLKYINIHGIFEDPTEVSNFTNINGEACYSEDSKYPVNQWMVPFIKEQVLNQIIKGGQSPEDTSNDATQNKVQSGE